MADEGGFRKLCGLQLERESRIVLPLSAGLAGRLLLRGAGLTILVNR